MNRQDGQNVSVQRTIKLQDDWLGVWIDNFYKAKQAEGTAVGTLHFYFAKLNVFEDFCDRREITQIHQITSGDLRDFINEISQTHNEGGTHAFYRAVKTLLRWFWLETEPPEKNPIDRLKAPRVPSVLLPPANLETISKLLDACRKTSAGIRNRAIILTLLDTGLRASELCNLLRDDFAQDGSLLVRSGKGRKSRTVFLSEKSRRAVRQYLRRRNDENPHLFNSHYGDALTYSGLRGIMIRLSRTAGVPTPPLHSFRRAYAIYSLRNGADLVSIQRVLGHSDLQVLTRYLKLCTEDIRATHARTSPVDRLK